MRDLFQACATCGHARVFWLERVCPLPGNGAGASASKASLLVTRAVLQAKGPAEGAVDPEPAWLAGLQGRALGLSHILEGLRHAAHWVQAACLAAVFFLRRLAGRPQPPVLHASPGLARLKACGSAEEAREYSRRLGYDANGALRAHA